MVFPFAVVHFAKENARPEAGGVKGLHGHLVRAPLDDAGRTGRMSGEAEQSAEGAKDWQCTGSEWWTASAIRL